MNPNKHANRHSADPEYFMAMLSLFIGKIKHRRKGDNMTQLHTSNKCSKKVKRHKQVLNSYPDIIIKSIKIHLKQENILSKKHICWSNRHGITTGKFWHRLFYLMLCLGVRFTACACSLSVALLKTLVVACKHNCPCT